jgi:hypothetical protein
VPNVDSEQDFPSLGWPSTDVKDRLVYASSNWDHPVLI